jgi:hypothetical protein
VKQGLLHPRKPVNERVQKQAIRKVLTLRDRAKQAFGAFAKHMEIPPDKK